MRQYKPLFLSTATENRCNLSTYIILKDNCIEIVFLPSIPKIAWDNMRDNLSKYMLLIKHVVVYVVFLNSACYTLL